MPAILSLERRQQAYDGQYGYRDRNRDSNWNSWGRYVAAVVVIFFFFFLISLCAIRRRQRHGFAPYNGTGWIARKFNNGGLRGGHVDQPPYGQQQQQQSYGPTYYPPPSQAPPNPEQDGFYSTPAPPYSPNPTFQQQQQIGVASPAPSTPYYAPPPGPPPAAVQNQSYEMTSPPPIPNHYTGSSVQSNNPYFQPPSSPPPAHVGGPPKY